MRASASSGVMSPELSSQTALSPVSRRKPDDVAEVVAHRFEIMTPSLPEQLRATVRFLGRVLGDVIRMQDGPAVFDQIEDIRQASVAFHREGTPKAAEA